MRFLVLWAIAFSCQLSASTDAPKSPCDLVLLDLLNPPTEAIRLDQDARHDHRFNDEILRSFRTERGAYAHQGRLATSQGSTGTPLMSDYFTTCHAVLIRNDQTGKVSLLHIEPTGPSERNQVRWITGSKQDKFNGLGAGPKRAVLIEGNLSAPESVRLTEAMLQSAGIPLVKHIRAQTGVGWWGMIYRPKQDQLIIGADRDQDALLVSLPKLFQTGLNHPAAASRLER